MSWQLTGRSMELCNCKLLCPCWLGPDGEPDEGFCSAALGFDIKKGASNGVDLGGTTVALAAHWPGNFFAGNGTGRVYIGDNASAEQHEELDGIFSGKKGGHLEGLFGAVFTTWLPTQEAKIDIQWEGKPTLTVGSVGKAELTPLDDGAGGRTKLTGSVGQTGFQFHSMDLADARGSRWSDPDIEEWRADSGTLQEFDWKS